MLKAARGTQDILGEDAAIWQYIEAQAIKIFSQAGFQELRSPIFEHTELFDRAVGQDSDIVNKEMYTFLDRSERSLTLRPEATASIVRAYLENNLDRLAKPQKLWYRGPMFRYERPQTGRYRQFHQIGIEAIGAPAPYIDIELIYLGSSLLQSLGLKDLKLHINSLGNANSRKTYTTALKDFLSGLQDKVCDDCKRRFEQNPLRCLDCKIPEDQALYTNAPKIVEFLDEEAKLIWQQVIEGLDKLGISYIVDLNLVRGLDYYSHCVFEIKTTDKELGSQSTVLAGGRYDSLVETLGGSPSPAVGWALGMERISLLAKPYLSQLNKSKSIFIVSDQPAQAQQLAFQLRDKLKDYCIEYDFEASKVKKQLERASKRNADWAIFYLEEERQKATLKAKNLKNTLEHANLSIDEFCSLVIESQGSVVDELLA